MATIDQTVTRLTGNKDFYATLPVASSAQYEEYLKYANAAAALRQFLPIPPADDETATVVLPEASLAALRTVDFDGNEITIAAARQLVFEFTAKAELIAGRVSGVAPTNAVPNLQQSIPATLAMRHVVKVFTDTHTAVPEWVGIYSAASPLPVKVTAQRVKLDCPGSVDLVFDTPKLVTRVEVSYVQVAREHRVVTAINNTYAYLPEWEEKINKSPIATLVLGADYGAGVLADGSPAIFSVEEGTYDSLDTRLRDATIPGAILVQAGSVSELAATDVTFYAASGLSFGVSQLPPENVVEAVDTFLVNEPKTVRIKGKTAETVYDVITSYLLDDDTRYYRTTVATRESAVITLSGQGGRPFGAAIAPLPLTTVEWSTLNLDTGVVLQSGDAEVSGGDVWEVAEDTDFSTTAAEADRYPGRVVMRVRATLSDGTPLTVEEPYPSRVRLGDVLFGTPSYKTLGGSVDVVEIQQVEVTATRLIPYSAPASVKGSIVELEDPVTTQGIPTTVSPDVALMIDVSGSMSTSVTKRAPDGTVTTATRLDFAKDAAKAAIATMQDGAYVWLGKFSTNASQELGWTELTAGNRTVLDSAIDGLTANGWTNYMRAHAQLETAVSGRPDPVTIVFISDGNPTDAKNIKEADVKSINQYDAAYSTISYGRTNNVYLRRMAEWTGGAYYDAPGPVELENAILDITTLQVVTVGTSVGYELVDNAELHYPVVGEIISGRWDIPEQEFTAGFPDNPGLTEWFALIYEGDSYFDEGGEYDFKAVSADGMRLFVDGQRVLDDAVLHATQETTGTVTLAPGLHRVRVEYFHGPGNTVAFQLYSKAPSDTDFVLFTIKERTKRITEYTKLVDIEVTRTYPLPEIHTSNPAPVADIGDGASILGFVGSGDRPEKGLALIGSSLRASAASYSLQGDLRDASDIVLPSRDTTSGIIFMLNTSSSTTGPNFDAMQSASIDLLRSLDPGYGDLQVPVSIIDYNTLASTPLWLESDFSTARQAFLNLTPGGGTATSTALVELRDQLSGEDVSTSGPETETTDIPLAKKAIMVSTRYGGGGNIALLKEIIKYNCTIDTVALRTSSDLAKEELREIAEFTGGSYYEVSTYPPYKGLTKVFQDSLNVQPEDAVPQGTTLAGGDVVGTFGDADLAGPAAIVLTAPAELAATSVEVSIPLTNESEDYTYRQFTQSFSDITLSATSNVDDIVILSTVPPTITGPAPVITVPGCIILRPDTGALTDRISGGFTLTNSATGDSLTVAPGAYPSSMSIAQYTAALDGAGFTSGTYGDKFTVADLEAAGIADTGRWYVTLVPFGNGSVNCSILFDKPSTGDITLYANGYNGSQAKGETITDATATPATGAIIDTGVVDTRYAVTLSSTPVCATQYTLMSGQVDLVFRAGDGYRTRVSLSDATGTRQVTVYQQQGDAACTHAVYIRGNGRVVASAHAVSSIPQDSQLMPRPTANLSVSLPSTTQPLENGTMIGQINVDPEVVVAQGDDILVFS